MLVVVVVVHTTKPLELAEAAAEAMALPLWVEALRLILQGPPIQAVAVAVELLHTQMARVVLEL
jgi:hypothetical protein